MKSLKWNYKRIDASCALLWSTTTSMRGDGSAR